VKPLIRAWSADGAIVPFTRGKLKGLLFKPQDGSGEVLAVPDAKQVQPSDTRRRAAPERLWPDVESESRNVAEALAAHCESSRRSRPLASRGEAHSSTSRKTPAAESAVF
jgi:hypothetical protein